MHEQDELNVLEMEEDETFLPDGWAEGDDFFADETWTGGAQTDEPADTTAETETDHIDEESHEGAPTTEQPEETDEQSAETEEAAEGSGQSTDGATESRKLKFRAKVDREEFDVEMDEAELPTIYQKAKVVDRVQQRLAQQKDYDVYKNFSEQANATARALGYESADEMLQQVSEKYRNDKIEELVYAGTPKEIAEDYVNRMMGGRPAPKEEVKEEPAAAPAAGVAPTRDFRMEATQFFALHPEWIGKQLPGEVSASWAAGMTLEEAFASYNAKQSTAEATKLRKENQVLRQNAAAAAKAPVKGVTGGGKTDTTADDDFIKGFDSDEW